MINPCPVCHSPMELLDPGAASDIYGWAIQDRTIACTNERCCTSFSLTADFMYIDVSDEDMIKMWNQLTLNTNRSTTASIHHDQGLPCQQHPSSN